MHTEFQVALMRLADACLVETFGTLADVFKRV